MTVNSDVTGAPALIIWRVVQGVGGALLFANSAAIVTDAFPANQRGTALSVNSIAAIGGSFIGSACEVRLCAEPPCYSR